MKNLAFASLSIVTLGILISCANFPSRKPVTASWADVKPILQGRCLVCHNGEHPVVMPDFTSRNMVRQFIKPGDAESSDLFRVLELSRKEPTAMPPTKHFLSRREREIIRSWIDQGAEWPDGKAGQLQPDPTMPPQISS